MAHSDRRALAALKKNRSLGLIFARNTMQDKNLAANETR